jgi:hypothetical protein
MSPGAENSPVGTPGLFLSLEELCLLFPKLKKNEAHLDVSERALLLRMERVLYENLSIQELETLREGNGIV